MEEVGVVDVVNAVEVSDEKSFAACQTAVGAVLIELFDRSQSNGHLPSDWFQTIGFADKSGVSTPPTCGRVGEPRICRRIGKSYSFLRVGFVSRQPRNCLHERRCADRSAAVALTGRSIPPI